MKRKRSRAKPTERAIFADLLLVLEGHDGSDEILDYVPTPKARSLRTRLAESDFDDLDAVSRHLKELSTTMRKDDLQDPLAIKQASTLYAFATALIEVENRYTSTEVEPNEDGHRHLSFSGRDIESRSLLFNSVSGPLFSSSTASALDTPRSSLPADVIVTDILPIPPTEVRLLGDLEPPIVSQTLSDPLQARNEKLLVEKRVDLGQYESFGLEIDRLDAITPSENITPYLWDATRHLVAASADTAGTTAGTPASSDTFILDEELLGSFDPGLETTDTSGLILQLSDLQHERMKTSPFAEPTESEQDLARRIMDQLQSHVLNNDVRPKDLLESRNKSDYAFVKYAPSYNGSMPATVSQWVHATRSQIRPQPSTHPLTKEHTKQKDTISAPKNAGEQTSTA